MRRLPWLFALALLGCGPDTRSPGSGTDTASDTEGAPEPEPVTLTLYRGVDILFVMDNSGSMNEEQALLSLALPGFVDALPRDWRIAVTTTDHGNPNCEDTTPEKGALVATSCRSRSQDFVSAGAVPWPMDSPCLESCPEIELQPSATRLDPMPAPRPWVERRRTGGTNLPAGLDPATALQCILPQGINGCGFEQPLQSIAAALGRSSTPGDLAEGFVRPDALLAIVVLTDEADCSVPPEHDGIFLADGDRVFWEDPEASSPGSSVCWNAGVRCSGGPGVYDECHPADLGPDGEPVDPATAETDAVMSPVSGYTDALRQIELDKQRIAPDHEVLVALIAGVAEDGTVLYADSENDPQFQANFGIGPGCESSYGRAIPPVRMRRLAEAFAVGDRPNLFSVCAQDYAPALEQIAAAIAAHDRPACVPQCVALEPSCEVWTETRGAGGEPVQTPVPLCATEGALPSDDVDSCWVWRSGQYLSPECRDGGWNLELAFTHRDDGAFPRDAAVMVRCEPSPDPAAECPSGA